MSIISCRNKVINMAKNLKYNEQHINDLTIIKLQQFINLSYNLFSSISDLFKYKFNHVIQKYNLQTTDNGQTIVFPLNSTQMKNKLLCKIISEFLYKIDFSLSVVYNQNNILQQLEDLINSEYFENISIIPMDVSEYENKVKTYDDNVETIIKTIINDQQFSTVENLQCDENKNIYDVRTNFATGSKKWNLTESNVKTLID